MKMNTLLASALLFALTSGAQAENITQTYEIAKQQDPLLNKIQARHIGDLEAGPQARSRFFPKVDAVADISGNYVDSTSTVRTADVKNDGDYLPQFNPFTTNDTWESHGATLMITMPIFHLENHINMDRAKVLMTKSDYQLQLAEQDLMVRVADAYLNILTAHDNLKAQQLKKTSAKQQLDQSKDKFNAGLVADLDVQEAQSGFDGESAKEIVALNTLQNTLDNLHEITGQYQKLFNKFNVESKFAVPQPNNIDTWVEKSIASSYQIRVSESDVKTAYYDKNLSYTGHLPVLDLTNRAYWNDAQGGVPSGNDKGDTFPYKQTNNTTSLQVSMPIFQGNYVTSRSRQAAQDHIASQHALTETHRAVENNTRHAYLAIVKNINAIEALKQASRSAEATMKATEQGLDAGIRTTTEVLNAQSRFHDANYNLAKEQYDFLRNSILLKQSAGVLTTADLKEADGYFSVAEFSVE